MYGILYVFVIQYFQVFLWKDGSMVNKVTNIKINYMLLEQIIRVMGVYKNLSDEYPFLDVMFKAAKTGEIDSLFSDDGTRDFAFKKIAEITGVPEDYWAGYKRIYLCIGLEVQDMNFDGETIDTIDLENDAQHIDKAGEGHAYHGLDYQLLLKNPLHLDYDEVYLEVHGSEEGIDEGTVILEKMYSLRGLITILLINMAEAGEIDIIDKANVYRPTKWKPYIDDLEVPSKCGITYSPKFIKVESGWLQVIIRSIYSLGYVFTFRDIENKTFGRL